MSEEVQELEALTLTELLNQIKLLRMDQVCPHQWLLIQHFKSMESKHKQWQAHTTSLHLCMEAPDQAQQVVGTRVSHLEEVQEEWPIES